MRPNGHGARFSLLVVGVCCLMAPAPPAFATMSSQDCGRLASLKLPATNMVSAELIGAGTLKALGGAKLPDLKAFCRVAALARPSNDSDVRFEVWLPASEWNGRLWAAGNGGFAGSIGYAALGARLVEGYATVGTDTGHQVQDGLDAAWAAAWAVGHREKVVDYGYRAIHEVTVRAKRIVAAFYGRKPSHAYFSSCSNGGRQGLMEAQRYPYDYDGIVAGAPIIEPTSWATGLAWIQFIWLAESSGYIPASKLPAIQSAALAACDALDGVEDGVIEDPQRCTFDPAVLQCRGAETAHCLTRPQLTALRKLYAGAVLEGGTRLVRGLSPGAEAAGDFEGFITGPAPGRSWDFFYAFASFRDLFLGDPGWDSHGFDPERDFKAARKLAPIVDAADPDLSKFAAHGGKLILYHGWNDPGIPALSSVDYYRRVVDTMGEKAAGESVRLFMVPGMEHCEGGPGPTSFGQREAGTGDPASKIGAALQRWVEQGIAPERIIATKRKNDEDPDSEVIRTRPICAYPRVARYRGEGSTDSASSFDCAAQP